jgi:hypothetical protein
MYLVLVLSLIYCADKKHLIPGWKSCLAFLRRSTPMAIDLHNKTSELFEQLNNYSTVLDILQEPCPFIFLVETISMGIHDLYDLL